MCFKLIKKKAVGGKSIAYGLWFAATAFFVCFLFAQNAHAATADYQGETLKFTEFLYYKQGDVASYTFKIKNTGKKKWEKGKVTLETGPFLNTASKVAHDSWLKPYRLATLAKDVAPGSTAEITVKLKAPTNIIGTIQENFQLVFNSKPITGTMSRLFIDMALPVVAKKEATKTVVTTTPTAQSSTANQTALSVTNPYTAVSTTTKKIPDFCIALTAEKKEEYAECQSNPNEVDNTNGIVKYQKALDKEPIIRVGLYSTTLAQRVLYAYR
jgi:hypothetical protein